MDKALKYGLPGLAGVLFVVAIGLGIAGPEHSAVFAWVPAVLAVGAAVVAHSARMGTLVTAAIAAGSNAYLLYLKVAPDAGSGFCPPTEVFDCSSINDSPASVLFGGTAYEVPITLIGVAFFVGLAVAASFGPKVAPRLFHVSAVFGFFNVLVSLYLGATMISGGHFCVFCVSIYAANLILIWAAYAGMKEAGQSLVDGLTQVPSSRSFLTVSGVFVAVTLVGLIAIRSNKPGGIDTTPVTEADPDSFRELYGEPSGKPRLTRTEATCCGSGPFKYEVLEFASFACPHCADSHEQLERVLADQHDVQLHLVPIANCNEVDAPVCRATMAAACAGRQGRYWAAAGALFANQRPLFANDAARKDLELLIGRADVDMAEWAHCMRDPTVAAEVSLSLQQSLDAQIRGTPHFFLKGTHGDDWVEIVKPGVDALLRVIDAHRQGVVLPPPQQTAAAGH